MGSIEQKVREIARRLARLRAIEVFLFGLLGAAGIFFVLILIDKFLLINLYPFHMLPVLVVAAGVLAVVASFSTRRSIHAAAIRADGDLKLKERLSTALISGDDSSPFTPLMIADAKRHAEDITVNEAFPIRVRTRAWLMPIALFVAGLLLSLGGPIDVFGRGKAIEKLESEKNVAKRIVEEVTRRIEKIKREKKFGELDEEVKKIFEGVLQETKKLVKRPESIKKTMQEIKKKEDEVSKKASEFAKARNAAAEDAYKELNQLRKLLQDIPRMMKNREIDKLMDKLDSMKDTISKSSKLTKKEKDALKKTLNQMARLARRMKNAGPDVVLPAEFKDLMAQLKGKYQSLPRELSDAEKEYLKKLLTNKEFLKKLKEQLRRAQQQLARGGG